MLLSVLVFLLLDALIFRSGFYGRVQKPVTPAGSMAAIIRFTSAAASNPERDVLVMGNSRTQYGLDIKKIEHEFPAAPFALVMGAFPDSNEESWYYALNRIDPARNRYAAIVIPMAGYRIAPYRDDPANHYEVAQMLTPIVPVSRLREFLDGFDDPALRWRAAMLALFPSHDYASDLQEVLLHPMQRLREVEARNGVGVKDLYDQSVAALTMDDLRLDPGMQKVAAYPERFNVLFRTEMNRQFVDPPAKLALLWTRRNAAFTAKWLRKIADAYSNSRTKLIFIDIPHEPVPLPAQRPLPGAPDIRDMLPTRPNITVLPAGLFENLERPHYFLDLAHMNAFGRALFSRQFGQAMMDAMASPPPAIGSGRVR